MFPKAKDCGFLKAEKKNTIPFPNGCFPIKKNTQGRLRVEWNNHEYYLTVTKQGWFALFPLNFKPDSKAAAVVLRLGYLDTFFESEAELIKYLTPPETPKVEYEWSSYANTYVAVSGTKEMYEPIY